MVWWLYKKNGGFIIVNLNHLDRKKRKDWMTTDEKRNTKEGKPKEIKKRGIKGSNLWIS